ncbi:sepiapterin reductase b [Pempheris klunzingeri]|uniref:sepiapterin reductase b n=1 Tax=Pempheris klunzingeri TaxID=3127111 RepID=UPI00397FCDD8
MADFCSTNPRTLGRAVCIITGASKGFGRALAHEVSHLLKPGSFLFLVARSETKLHELKEELQSFTGEQLAVHCIAVDLSTTEGVNETIRMAKQEAGNEIDHVLLINNVGSLSNLSRFTSTTDLHEVNSYLSLNVSSTLVLTSGIMQAFPQRPGLRWSVVNVSSILAQQAIPSWVLYCTGKAARNMMFRVLAEEEPNIKVLSYSPGSLDTDLQKDIRRLTGVEHHLVPCQESAAKLMKLLLDNEFTSGIHLDFFDV